MSDAELDEDSVRFFGGQFRLLSQRVGLEVSIDSPGRHFGVHGDYHYTFLDFGDDVRRMTTDS